MAKTRHVKYIKVKKMNNHICPFFTAVSKPAPQWEGTAVVNGEFKELKLSDFKGKVTHKIIGQSKQSRSFQKVSVMKLTGQNLTNNLHLLLIL